MSESSHFLSLTDPLVLFELVVVKATAELAFVLSGANCPVQITFECVEQGSLSVFWMMLQCAWVLFILFSPLADFHALAQIVFRGCSGQGARALTLVSPSVSRSGQDLRWSVLWIGWRCLLAECSVMHMMTLGRVATLLHAVCFTAHNHNGSPLVWRHWITSNSSNNFNLLWAASVFTIQWKAQHSGDVWPLLVVKFC